jgi:hypothetical protein
VDRALVTADAPEHRRASLAERGALAAGEHGSHPPALLCQLCTPHGVDTAHNRMQAALRDAVLDGLRAQPERAQLRARNDPVLGLGKLPGR